VGILGIAWAFGGMIFILVYCTAGISGPAAGLARTQHAYAAFVHSNRVMCVCDT
jgi:hypothetical protein